jgi:hypothetical protein
MGEASGKGSDVLLHRRVPEAFEMKRIHLGDGLLRSPMVKGQTVSARKHAGAICSQPTMNEDGLPRMRSKQSKELSDLFIGGR